jgi:hypothetical protein
MKNKTLLSDETLDFIAREINSSSANVHQIFAWRLSLSVLPRIFTVSESEDLPNSRRYQLAVLRTVLAASVTVAARHLQLFRRPKFFRFPRLETLDSVYRTALLAFQIANSHKDSFESLEACIEFASISFDPDDLRLRLELINRNIDHEVTVDEFPSAKLRPMMGLPKESYDYWYNSAEYIHAAEWSFWREWYQGFLDGKPLDWELQRRVALIDDAIWEAGPEAVAEEIKRIRAAYKVERRAAELEASAQTALRTTRGMGDNNPPSPIEDALATSDGVTIIWAAAQELKDEAQSETPDKTRVEKAIGAIVGVLKACGIWAAKKVDKGLNAAVIAAGSVGGPAGVVWITQNSDKLIELVKAAEAWLPFIR